MTIWHSLKYLFSPLLIIGLSIGASAESNILELEYGLVDNGPVLQLIDDVTVCSGSAIELAELPVIETTGVPVDYTYHLSTPVSPSNMISTENLVVTSDDVVYVAADDGSCVTVLEVPVEFVLSPILVTEDVVSICSGEAVDLSTIQIEDIENTGMPITFHTSNNPTSGNIITDLVINPTISTTVYAFSQLGVCEYVLPIPINVIPTPNLFITTEPVICVGLDLDLNTLLLTDLNNTGAPITVHSSLPASAQNDITGQTINYTASSVIYASAQSGSCLDELPINITVTSSLYAGEDNVAQGCESTGDYDLINLVTPNADPGTFVPVGNIPYFDPVTNTFDTDSAPAGIYNFEYVVDGDGQCLADQALLELELINETSAGADNFREICEGISGPVTMGQFLNGATSTTGVWRQLTGPPIDVSDPSNVDFSLIPSDTLIFEYIINEPEECEADTSIITIDVTPAPFLDGTQVRCSDDLSSYTFAFWTDYTNVSVDFGTIIQVGDEYQVQDIPISQAINITLVNEKNCSSTIHINPPECTCAFVAMPISVNSVEICVGEPVPAMNVVLAPGVAANWYDAEVGGQLLFANGVAYNPSLTDPGEYTYYVEVYSQADNSCINENLTEISLNIYEYPPAFPIEISGCASEGMVMFDFEAITSTLDPSGEIIYGFYLSQQDAMNNTNPLPNEYSADESSLNNIYATIEYGGGCQTVVEAELTISPNPDVTFGANDISCEDIFGSVFIENNDPSQTISMSYNFDEYTSALEVENLFGGNYNLRAKNEFGCVVEEWLKIEVQTGFTIEYGLPECNGNGTPSDPTDDFEIWTFNLESETASTEFEVVNKETGESYGFFLFGQPAVITIPIDGSWYILDFIDRLDTDCSESVTLGSGTTCSDQCGITTVNVENIYCDDNLTPANPFDDRFYLDLEVLAVNASNSWILDGPLQFTGTYGEVQTVGPFEIAEHTGSLIFQDNLSSDCFFEINFDVPETCSNACEVNLVEFTPIACDDAFTGPILDDDIFSVAFIFENINLGKREYLLEVEGEIFGPFVYDELAQIDGITAPSGELAVYVIDEENQVCIFDFTIALTPCSECVETTNIVTGTLNLNCVADPIIPEVELSLSGQAEWFDLANNNSISNELFHEFDQVGSYEVVVNHDNLCVTSDRLEVIQENIIPVAQAGEELILNCFDTIVTLQGSTVHPTDILYQWMDENNEIVSTSTDGEYATDIEGVYQLVVTDTLRKCVSDFSQTEILRDVVIPNFSVSVFPNDTLTCFNAAVEANVVENIEGHAVSWVVNENQIEEQTLTINEVGVYSLEVQDLNNGCIQSQDFEIFKNADFPKIDIAFPDTLNCRNNMIVIDGSLSSEEEVITNQWYDEDFNSIVDAQNLTLEVEEGGMYFLELSNEENGCVELDSIFIIQDQVDPVIQAGLDDYIRCFNDDYQLNGQLMMTINDYTVGWESEEGNSISNEAILNPIISDTGSYYLKVINNINYCETKDTVHIAEDPNLIHSIELDYDDPLCFLDENGIIVVQDVETAGTNLLYYFNGQLSPDDNILDGQVGGDFEIQIVNDEGCAFDTLISLVDPYLLTLDLNTSDEETINLGDSIHIEAITNILPENIASVEWSHPESHTSPDNLTTSIFPYSRTSYEIIVTDVNGCVISNSLKVYVTEDVYLYFPNVFSIAPDSNNPEFMIHGDRQVEEITLFEIFDRWGNKVFKTENFRPGEAGSGWDGRYEGQDAAPGVYIYRVEARLKNGKEKYFVGDVTLVK